MIKTIKLDEGVELTLSNSNVWLYEYQDQFGHDILPDLMPLLGAVLRLIENISEQGLSVKEAQEITKAVAGEGGYDALIELAGLRITDLINIAWAMAKAADDSVPEPKKWLRSFEAFPLDIVVPEVFAMAAQGAMSRKNWTSLQQWIGKLRAPKEKKKKSTKRNSATSPSQESKEA